MTLDQIVIDPEFRDFLPPLGDEALDRLRAKIELEGWSDEPITVWKDHGILLDGHNRHAIWQERGDDGPKVREFAFATRDAALHWVAFNQCCRRNLTPEQQRYVLGKQYKAEKNVNGGARDGAGRPEKSERQSDELNKPSKNNTTAKRLGKELGVGQSTVERAERYADAVDDLDRKGVVPKADLLGGKVKVPAAAVVAASNADTPEEAKAVIARAKTGQKSDGEPKERFSTDTARNLTVAKKNYERLGILFGQVGAIAEGIERINLDAAMSVLRTHDAEEWIEEAKRTVSALKALSQRLKTEAERARPSEATGQAEDGMGDGGEAAG